MKSLKIGMLTACYLPRLNGVTRMIAQYKRSLETAGHTVTIFTFGAANRAKDAPDIVQTQGIPLREGYGYSFGVSRSTRARLREMDIVHCHHIGMGLDMAQRYFPGPIVFTNHTRYDIYSQIYGGLPAWAAARLARLAWGRPLNRADVVISPSRGLKTKLRSIGVQRPIEVIPNGIETRPFRMRPEENYRDRLEIPEEGLLCIFIGRVAREKNVSSLVTQFTRASTHRSDLVLLIVGDGPQKSRLQREIRKRGLENRIRLAGAAPFSEIPSILAAGDMFITASRSEIHSLAVMEAMAAGLPVLAPAGAGFEETLRDGANGLLYSGADGLSRAILKLAGDDGLRKYLGANARRESLQFDIQFSGEKTVALYRRLIRAAAADPTRAAARP